MSALAMLSQMFPGRFTEVVVVSAARRIMSYDAQLAAGARVVTLGVDVTRLVFRLLSLKMCVVVSHVCAYWRWVAAGDPLLWTTLNGSPVALPVMWARAGSTTHIDVRISFRGSMGADVSPCIIEHLSRMTSLKVFARGAEALPKPDLLWNDVLQALCRPAPRLIRLLLEGPRWRNPQTPTEIFPSTAFAFMSSLRQISLLQLKEFKLGRTIRGGYNTWRIIPRVLNYLEAARMDHVNVCHLGDEPVLGILNDFVVHTMSLLPTTFYRGTCDLLVVDLDGRLRRIRGANFERLDNFPGLWQSLATLTVCGDLTNPLPRPPPPTPSLQLLRIFFRRGRYPRTQDNITLWKTGDESWQCPALTTVEFALTFPLSNQPTVQPITMPLRAARHLVTAELASSRVTSVIVTGRDLTISSEPGERCSFSLRVDKQDYYISVVDTALGFDDLDE
ncbi:hypothetical protein EXIGLDRAFT_837599 [Exidia glandulosa HHB12029]|uniref:F-box domain-containing protein n=1 Tax=Exidia glandulosa HHB12029 TaxID=1314781 RepID=A0A166AD19_EXIGL|nr:hypothetical protein EXIGLDRAFT_837599 [Exidia glandulosa HHB12029]